MSILGKKITTALIDLSGTLHIDNCAIPGAVEALSRLKESNVRVKYVTNTTKESRRFLYERLVSLGFKLDAEEIFTSLHAAKQLIQIKRLKPMLLIDEAAWEDFEEFREEKNYNAVVIGLAPQLFNYATLNDAFRLLLNGAELIAIHEARYFKQTDGLSLGPGPFVKGLEYATDKKATVVGKPTASFFKSALGEVDPQEAVMIGDDVRDDIDGAQKIGIRGILVQTGKYRDGDEAKINPPPALTCNSFTEAVDNILKHNKKTDLSEVSS